MPNSKDFEVIDNSFEPNYGRLQQGDIVLGKSPTGELLRGQIITFFSNDVAYIHFIGQNRRKDITTEISNLQFVDHAPSPTNEPPHRGRRKKRSELEQRFWTIEEINKFELSNVRNIEYVEFDTYYFQAWYSSPYPDEYICNRRIFICDRCMKCFPSRALLQQHVSKPHKYSYPPGFEIYRDNFNDEQISFYEIDGNKDTLFCQHLCLFARLFLEDKCVFYDIGNFMFYVMATFGEDGVGHIVGFYSLDKAIHENIIACIAVWPQYQGRGYGKMLISLAYTIAKRKSIRGGPETPLSDLGLIAFRSYWRDTILECIHANLDESENLPEIDQISEYTWILPNDVHDTLKDLELLVKPQKGRPSKIDFQAVDAMYDRFKGQMRAIKPENLIWLPPQAMPKLSSEKE